MTLTYMEKICENNDFQRFCQVFKLYGNLFKDGRITSYLTYQEVLPV